MRYLKAPAHPPRQRAAGAKQLGSYWPYCRSEGMPVGMFRCRFDGSCESDRLPLTAAMSSEGLNGFCRLETAPNLVAMCRKSGVLSEVKLNGYAETFWLTPTCCVAPNSKSI